MDYRFTGVLFFSHPPAGQIHNNADALSCLVQTNSNEPTMLTKHAQQPAFVSTIHVKLSRGRTAIVKPLIIDTDGNLINIHDHNRDAISHSPREVGQVNTITLNPTVNLRDSQ